MFVENRVAMAQIFYNLVILAHVDEIFCNIMRMGIIYEF